MRISSKVIAPVGGLSLAMVLSVVLALWLGKDVSDANSRFSRASTEMIEASETRALSRAIQRDSAKLLSDAWSAKRAALAESINSRAQEVLIHARKLAAMVDPKNTEMTQQFVKLQEAVVAGIGSVKAAALSGDMAMAKEEFLKKVEPAEKAASALTDGFFDETEKRVNELSAEAERVQSLARTTLIGFSALSLLLSLGASFLIAFRGIAWPLSKLTDGMRRLAGGDFDVVLPGLGRKDEIGEIAGAVGTFKVKSAEKARQEADEAMRRQGDEAAAQARIAAERERVAAEQSLAMVQLGEALINLAEKNLTYRITDDLPAAYQKLQTDFNSAIGQLEGAMQGVNGSTDAINSSTQEISTASDDLSRRTEQQAASLEETAAALDEITATVKKSSEGADHAREVVAAADQDAKKGAVVVREAVLAMDAIAGSAQKISQIIGVVDEIAFQTNLLALNAGVEAARAGDAGRGFAVVASEVRALAQRSADAAKEIKGLISESTTQVDRGVKLVAETGKSLERIVAQVGDINGVVAQIANGAKEQATALQDVNTAINQMDQVTQQNAAMVEESTAASHSLSQETQQLSGLIGQFQVGEAVGNDRMRRELQKVAPHAFGQPAKASAVKRPGTSKSQARPVRAQLKAVANGAATGDEGGWKEF